MENISEIIKASVRGEKHVVSVHLFGSWGRGEERAESDVDLAILYTFDNVPDKLHLIELREQLADKLGKAVDLVCLNTASPIIGMQVIKSGKELIIKDSKIYNRYLCTLYTDYADLKRMRHSMEQDILERKFYG